MDALVAKRKLQTNQILRVVAVDGCIHVQRVCEGFWMGAHEKDDMRVS